MMHNPNANDMILWYHPPGRIPAMITWLHVREGSKSGMSETGVLFAKSGVDLWLLRFFYKIPLTT